MNLLSVYALASAARPRQPGDGAGRTFFKALLLASALLGGGLAAGPADASLTITTTGTITSGSETGGLFGLPVSMTSLVGDSYTLVVHYNYLGPNYLSNGDGSGAQDFESLPGLTGFVTAVVNGVPLTTALTNSLATTLLEDNFNFFGSNQGYNGPSATGDFVDVTQILSCTACIPYADLQAPVNYVLVPPFDFSSDQYMFQGGGFPTGSPPTANFFGTATSFSLVPEPPSWLLLATALLGLSMLVRHRQA